MSLQLYVTKFDYRCQVFYKKNYFFINSDHTQMHPVTMSMIAIIIHSFMDINIRCKCKHIPTPPSHSLKCNKVFIICQDYYYKNDIKTLLYLAVCTV